MPCRLLLADVGGTDLDPSRFVVGCAANSADARAGAHEIENAPLSSER